jgi:hypothetical protein
MRGMTKRLARLENGCDRTGPEWWAIMRWLGHSLTPDQSAAVDQWDASSPPYDPAAPVDMSGWSPAVRRWLGA